MKKELTTEEAVKILLEDENANWSRGGATALVQYLESMEEDTGEDIAMDHVALRCEFSEYESAYEAMRQYQPEDMPIAEDTGVDENGHGMDLVEIAEAEEKMAMEWLEERTTVIPFDDRITLTDGTVLGNKGVIIYQF